MNKIHSFFSCFILIPPPTLNLALALMYTFIFVIDYLRYLVIDRKISSSYQNQAINSIKFYFERVLGEDRKVYMIERPREEKTLPLVLNETEISNLLKVTENIKHKAKTNHPLCCIYE